MKYEFEILETEERYQGFLGLRSYQLRHSLFAGGESPVIVRERVESYRAASVLLYDPDLDQVVLIEQFRIGALDNPGGAWVVEVIGGIIDDNEAPDLVARREAVEEAGCQIQELLPICEFMVSPGYSTERIYLFCGRVDSSGAAGIHGIDEEGEDIRVQVMAAQEAIEILYRGPITSTSTVISLQWLALNRERLLAEWRS